MDRGDGKNGRLDFYKMVAFSNRWRDEKDGFYKTLSQGQTLAQEAKVDVMSMTNLLNCPKMAKLFRQVRHSKIIQKSEILLRHYILYIA